MYAICDIPQRNLCDHSRSVPERERTTHRTQTALTHVSYQQGRCSATHTTYSSIHVYPVPLSTSTATVDKRPGGRMDKPVKYPQSKHQQISNCIV